MASTYSDLKIELIGTGEQAGTWGATTNANLGTAVEEAIVGSADVSFSSANVTLTLIDTNGTQVARHLRLNLTGTSGGARELVLGSGCQIDKPYIINNGLADAVTVKNTTGTGVVVPAGKSMWVFNNGTNVVEVVTHVNATVTGNVTGNVTGEVNSLSLSRGGGNVATNVAVGANALASNTTGTSNTAIGQTALQSNTTGQNNTAVGQSALNANTGSLNTAVGLSALTTNTSGGGNAALGHAALLFNTTGDLNVAVGISALQANTTGSDNTAIGPTALQSNTTGTNNTGIGNGASASSATVSNTITLGNGSITTLRCQATTISSLSDIRDKKNIVDIPAGLSFIQALRPVSFDWNMRSGAKVDIPEFGFIAQELQAAQKATGVTVPNLIYDDNPEKLEASPGTLIPILVKAIQELSFKLDAQTTEIVKLKERLS